MIGECAQEMEMVEAILAALENMANEVRKSTNLNRSDSLKSNLAFACSLVKLCKLVKCNLIRIWLNILLQVGVSTHPRKPHQL